MAILAIQYPTFQPAMRIVSGITNAFPAVITTTFAHQYKDGAIIRVYIPEGYGMQELNQQYAPIKVTSSTAFEIELDTRLYSSYSVPVTFPENYQSAQVVPIGENDFSLKSATKNVLPYRM